MKKISMDKFTVGKDYPYSLITDSRPGEAILRGYGDQIIGRYFITVVLPPDIDPQEQICSFLLTGSSKEYIFTCIYNDFKAQ